MNQCMDTHTPPLYNCQGQEMRVLFISLFHWTWSWSTLHKIYMLTIHTTTLPFVRLCIAQETVPGNINYFHTLNSLVEIYLSTTPQVFFFDIVKFFLSKTGMLYETGTVFFLRQKLSSKPENFFETPAMRYFFCQSKSSKHRICFENDVTHVT
jgi:hypothetical protein